MAPAIDSSLAPACLRPTAELRRPRCDNRDPPSQHGREHRAGGATHRHEQPSHQISAVDSPIYRNYRKSLFRLLHSRPDQDFEGLAIFAPRSWKTASPPRRRAKYRPRVCDRAFPRLEIAGRPRAAQCALLLTVTRQEHPRQGRHFVPLQTVDGKLARSSRRRLPAKAVKTIASVGKTQIAPHACFALFLKRLEFTLRSRQFTDSRVTTMNAIAILLSPVASSSVCRSLRAASINSQPTARRVPWSCRPASHCLSRWRTPERLASKGAKLHIGELSKTGPRARRRRLACRERNGGPGCGSLRTTVLCHGEGGRGGVS
jgi:hypothetical protein